MLLGEENIIVDETLTTTRIEGFPKFYNADMAFRFSSQGKPTKGNEYFYPKNKMLFFWTRELQLFGTILVDSLCSGRWF